MGMSIPQDPAIPLLGIYPKEAHSYNKDIWSMMFIAAVFVIARNWKQPKMPLNGGMDRENVVHLDNGVLLSIDCFK